MPPACNKTLLTPYLLLTSNYWNLLPSLLTTPHYYYYCTQPAPSLQPTPACNPMHPACNPMHSPMQPCSPVHPAYMALLQPHSPKALLTMALLTMTLLTMLFVSSRNLVVCV